MNINKDYFDLNENIKQNNIEDILEPEEQVLVELRPDKGAFIMESIFKGLPFTLAWAAFDTFFIIMMITNNLFTEPYFIPMMIGFFAIHLIPVWIYIAQMVKRLLEYKNINYYLTDKRIIIRSGVIGIDFKYFYYYDISSVVCKVSFIDKLFKVGDIYIKSINQTAIIEDIKAPYAYSTRIQKIIQDIKTDIAYPNKYRPDNNPGYNTKYGDK